MGTESRRIKAKLDSGELDTTIDMLRTLFYQTGEAQSENTKRKLIKAKESPIIGYRNRTVTGTHKLSIRKKTE